MLHIKLGDHRTVDDPSGDPMGRTWLGYDPTRSDDELFEVNRGQWMLGPRAVYERYAVFSYTGDHKIKLVAEIDGVEPTGNRRALTGRALSPDDPIARRWIGAPAPDRHRNPVTYFQAEEDAPGADERERQDVRSRTQPSALAPRSRSRARSPRAATAEALARPIPGPDTSADPVPRRDAIGSDRMASGAIGSARQVSNANGEPFGSREVFHAWAERWYARLGSPAEPRWSLDAVEAWRQAWRPERVRILLVAESHVGYLAGDEHARVNRLRIVSRPLPSAFVRLVYCLGYGESKICTAPPASNAGTWQFWDIFGQLALGADQPRKTRSTPQQRLRWKVSVLEQLAEVGVWLQDASPLGLYLAGGSRADAAARRHYAQLLREGYMRGVLPSVAEDRPEQTWLIGHSVRDALVGLPGVLPTRVISQPQDRTAGQHRAGLERLRQAIR